MLASPRPQGAGWPPARGADRGGGMTQRLTLRRPDDWHVHLRDGPMLAAVAGYTARQLARAIVMPNLSPPITTAAAAEEYRDRNLAALPPGHGFPPAALLPPPRGRSAGGHPRV